MLEQARPIFRPAVAILLELDQPRADEPVAENEVAVDRASGSGFGVLVGLGNRGNERVVVHGFSL